ncbi:hypothetical protein OG394_09765 [Kribbella sp. NBC_01245]|uniref:hypothetical protein n=1 Tax=Kribbella sp. NBC_01245 TaxID=2903578 RepID=UPI002E27DF3C|nr:hypothetical protein [Kribbella sp. NBC_01245]
MGQEVAVELMAAVEASLVDSPYVVRPTRAGFDVALNLTDARWWSLYQRQGLRHTFVQHVALKRSSRLYRVTDEAYEVDWAVGAAAGLEPRLGIRIKHRAGRVVNLTFTPASAVRDVQTDYTFSSEEARRLITNAARRLGWVQRLDRAQKVGIIIGVAGLAVALTTIFLAITYA